MTSNRYFTNDVSTLREWAGRYRRFASTLFDRRSAAELENRATELEAAAAEIESRQRLQQQTA